MFSFAGNQATNDDEKVRNIVAACLRHGKNTEDPPKDKSSDTVCHFCNKVLHNKSNLRKHWRIHTGEKPYKCSECSLSFSHSSSLKNHYRLHTGERPYRCSYCASAYASLSARNSHVFHQHKFPRRKKYSLIGEKQSVQEDDGAKESESDSAAVKEEKDDSV